MLENQMLKSRLYFPTWQHFFRWVGGFIELHRLSWPKNGLTIVIEEGRNRSREQNDLLHAWARLKSHHTGVDHDVIIGEWKEAYLLRDVRNEDEFVDYMASKTIDTAPEPEYRAKSADFIVRSSNLGVRRFSEWLDKIQRVEAQQGIDLPSPDEGW